MIIFLFSLFSTCQNFNNDDFSYVMQKKERVLMLITQTITYFKLNKLDYLIIPITTDFEVPFLRDTDTIQLAAIWTISCIQCSASECVSLAMWFVVLEKPPFSSCCLKFRFFCLFLLWFSLFNFSIKRQNFTEPSSFVVIIIIMGITYLIICLLKFLMNWLEDFFHAICYEKSVGEFHAK